MAEKLPVPSARDKKGIKRSTRWVLEWQWNEKAINAYQILRMGKTRLLKEYYILSSGTEGVLKKSES